MTWIIICQLFIAAYNAWNAKYHARLFDQHKTIHHGLWALIYCAVVAPFWFVHPALPFLALLQRIPIFNPVLNLSRHPKKPLFYLGTGSTIDRLIATYYKPVFFGCIAAVIILNATLAIW